MDHTHTYTSFVICSKGEITNDGLQAYKDGIFCPSTITEMLNIKPSMFWKKGDPRRNGKTPYGFSLWEARLCDNNTLDIEEQLIVTINKLKMKIDILKSIKSMYNVDFNLSIVPHIYNGEQPCLELGKEIIEFCYLTSTEVSVDMHIYPFKEED